MDITISVIPHGQHRYPTCGDWQFDRWGNLHVKVSILGDWRKEALIGLHEVIEALLCRHQGITEQQVDEFDFSFLGEGEPGDDLNCPYKHQHFFATNIERMLAQALGVDWKEYSNLIEELFNGNETARK